MLLRVLLLAVLCLYAGTIVSQADSDSAWLVVVYDETVTEVPFVGNGKLNTSVSAQVESTATRQLYFIGTDGLRETVTLPPLYDKGINDSDYYTTNAFMSPDLRYLMVNSSSITEVPEGMRIIDLETMELAYMYDTAISPTNFQGTQFAALYDHSEFDMLEDAYAYDIGMMIVDAATATVTASIGVSEIYEIIDADFTFPFEGLLVDSWQADGVHFLPTCGQCSFTRVYAGTDLENGTPYYVWNPDTNEVKQSEEHLYFANGVTLPMTGERLHRILDDGYATVEYSNSSDVPASDPHVVFDGGQAESLSNPIWVLDGNAFLVRSGAAPYTLVARDGAQQQVELSREIIGTPDGWLTISRENGVYAYVVTDGTVTETEVLQFDPAGSGSPATTLIVAHIPALGTTAGDESFPSAEATAAAGK